MVIFWIKLNSFELIRQLCGTMMDNRARFVIYASRNEMLAVSSRIIARWTKWIVCVVSFSLIMRSCVSAERTSSFEQKKNPQMKIITVYQRAAAERDDTTHKLIRKLFG